MKILTILICALSVCCARGVEVRRDRFDFSVSLPADYEDVSALPGLKDELVAVGVWNAKRDGLVRLVSISGFSGALSRQDIGRYIPKQPNILSEKVRWKNLEIDSFEIIEESAGQRWLTINTLVPTLPRAIQLRIFGPASEEVQMKALRGITLASLEAKTNWLNTGERWSKGNFGIAGMAVAALMVVWIVRKSGKKKANQTSEPTAVSGRGSL